MLRQNCVNRIVFAGKTTWNIGKWIIKAKDLKSIRIVSLLPVERTRNKIPAIIINMKYYTPNAVYAENY